MQEPLAIAIAATAVEGVSAEKAALIIERYKQVLATCPSCNNHPTEECHDCDRLSEKKDGQPRVVWDCRGPREQTGYYRSDRSKKCWVALDSDPADEAHANCRGELTLPLDRFTFKGIDGLLGPG